MSIHLKLDDVDFNQPKENNIKLQYIPANVDEATAANIDQYFNNYTTEIDGLLKNSLRGFPLNGCQFKVPSEYRGVVFREDQRPLDENVDRTFKVDGIFDEFTYWNYDKLPSNNDKLKQALDWNTFAQALHEPITAEEYAEELKSQNKT